MSIDKKRQSNINIKTEIINTQERSRIAEEKLKAFKNEQK